MAANGNTSNVKTVFFVSQQGDPKSAIFFATFLLGYKQGGYPLLLLGPNTAAEASSVRKVVNFYRKLMVRDEEMNYQNNLKIAVGRLVGWSVGRSVGRLVSWLNYQNNLKIAVDKL